MAGAVIVIIGSIVSFVTNDNFAPVSYWLSSVWKGDSPSAAIAEHPMKFCMVP
jgi:hypothetical protein